MLYPSRLCITNSYAVIRPLLFVVLFRRGGEYIYLAPSGSSLKAWNLSLEARTNNQTIQKFPKPWFSLPSHRVLKTHPDNTPIKQTNKHAVVFLQAGACCSLSRHLDAAAGEEGGAGSRDASRPRFLVSTRGSAASHAVFGLDASPQGAASTNRETLADDGVDAVSFGADDGANRGGGSGASREGGGGGRGGDGSGVSPTEKSGVGSAVDRRSAVSERLSWAERWNRLPIVAQVRKNCIPGAMLLLLISH